MKRSGSPLVLSSDDKQRMARVESLHLDGEAGVAELISLLVDPSWAVRRAVVAALAGAGDGGVAALCQVLVSQRSDEARIAAAVDALSASRAPSCDAEVLRLFGDSRLEVVADAAQILGRRKSAAGVPALEKLTQTGDDNVAVAAIEALGRIGGGAGIEALNAVLRGDNFFRVFPAIGVLGRSEDPRAVAPLIALLSHAFYGAEAARALGRIGDPGAIRPLARTLARSSDAMARAVALALAEIRGRVQALFGSSELVAKDVASSVDSNAVVERLAQVVPGSATDEQDALCEVIGWMQSEAAAGVLVRLLDIAPGAATAALGVLGSEADDPLEAALVAGDSARRMALLPLVAARSRSATSVLVCLGDADPAVRVLACNALGRIGDPSAVPALFALLGDGAPLVSQAVVGAIQSLGSKTTESLALESASSTDPNVRRAAIRIIAYFGYAAGLEALLAAIAGPDDRVREAAVHGLAYVDDERALQALLSVSSQSSARMRAAALRALGKVTATPQVVQRLQSALEDPDAWARYYACQSLGALHTEGATEDILRLTRDPAGQVRVAAVEALSRLQGTAAFEGLRAAAASTDADVQRAALVGLGLQKRGEAFPLLAHAARSAEPATKLIALSSLAGYESAQVLPVLAGAASDPDENVRAAAIGLLATRPEPGAAATLIGLLSTTFARDRAVAALATQGERMVPALAAALPNAPRGLATALVAVLSRIGSPAAIDTISSTLSLPNVEARRAAAAALTLLPGLAPREPLLRGSRDEDAEVRRLSLSALSR